MHIIKKLFKLLVVSISIGIFSIVSLLIYNHYFSIGGEIKNGINQDNILSIKIGITEKKVYEILGKPINFTNEEEDKYLVYGIAGLLDAGAEITLVISSNKLKHLSIESYDMLIYKCALDNPCVMHNKNDFDRVIPH